MTEVKVKLMHNFTKTGEVYFFSMSYSGLFFYRKKIFRLI